MGCDSKTKKQSEKTKKLLKRSLSKRYEDGVDKFFEKVEVKFDKGLSKTPLDALIITKDVKDVADMVNSYRLDMVEMAKNANKISKFLSEELSDADSIALTRALSGDGNVPAHLTKVYDRFRKIIDANAAALVKSGMLDEKYKIKDYLKRYYKQYLEDRHGFSIAVNKLFKRKDLTHEERLEIGLVENADFVVSNTLLEQRKQLQKGRLLKQVADEFGIDDEKAGYVRVSDETVGGGIYKYGALAGKYLPEKVYAELIQARMIADALSILDRSVWTDVIDHVKVNVTVKNPGTHLYNVTSNIGLAFLNGDLVAIGQVLKMAVLDRKKFKKLVKLSKKFGLNSDLHDYEKLHTNLNFDKNTNIFIRFFKNLYMAEGTKLGNGVRKIYSAEDEIFKLASFYKRIQGRKISTTTAKAEFKEAMKDYVDYSTPLPKWVRRLDRNGVFPFLHYTWKSTPRVAKIIVKNPIKFTMLQVALLSTGASIFSEDDNDQKPEWGKDKGLAGQSKYLPSNLFAAKQYVQTEDEYFLNIGRSLPGMRLGGLKFDGGFIGGAINLVQGKDPRGREYFDAEDSTGVAFAKGVLKATENYAPSITYGRYMQRAVKKVIGVDPAKNDFGIEQSWEEIALRMFGVWRFDREKHVEKELMNVIKLGAEIDKSREEIQIELDEVIAFARKNKLRYSQKKIDAKFKRDFKKFSDSGVLYKKLQSLVRVKKGESREDIVSYLRATLKEAKEDGVVLDEKEKKNLRNYVKKYEGYFD